MNRSERIIKYLSESFQPAHLEVLNESGNHSAPPGAESHFRVRVVSEVFKGQGLVKRHRSVYQALQPELDLGLHALAIEAYAPEEWKGGQDSPPCAHST